MLRYCLPAFVGLIGSFCDSIHAQDGATRPPNIVFILADDMGYGDLTSLNPDSQIPTRNIDRLTRSGMHFTDAHSLDVV